jgi:cystathionine beta-lyase/cystathionine gamma-synthase
MKRFTRNALLVANEVLNDPALADVVRPIYPQIPCHPDYKLAENLSWVGGVLTFRFLDPALNERGALNSFIEIALAVARQHRVSLTKGVSFGFSLPRISAAAAMSESSPPFLRLSVGDRSRNETTALAMALREAFVEFTHAARTY